MITRTYTHFDLKQIAASGQCFRLRETAPGRFSAVSGEKALTVVQEGDCFSFHCSQEDFPFWETYFDLHTDYGKVQEMISPKDPYLMAAARFGSGIRILRQDLWEMIITFVISQQRTIPKIREAVEQLSALYGHPIPGSGGGSGLIPDEASVSAGRPCGGPDGGLSAGLDSGPGGASQDQNASRRTFPTPEELNRASLDDLAALKLGYRAKYIKRLCQDAAEGTLNLERLWAMDYAQAMEYLTGFYGIGVKVANCVCLYGLHHIDAFPVDTWIQKILLREYYPRHPRKYAALPRAALSPAIVRDFFGRYRGCQGIMQQYIFYYERFRDALDGLPSP